MAKIKLNDVLGGYNLSAINSNFQRIEDEFNQKVSYRDNPKGEPNSFKDTLDMNGHVIYNLGAPYLEHHAVRFKEFKDLYENVGYTTSANLIDFSPYLSLTADNVQGAIAELKDEVDNLLVDVDVAVTTVDSVADLRSFTVSTIDTVVVKGYYAPADGGGGIYYRDPTQSLTDNNGTEIVAADGSHWKLDTKGIVSVKQFGSRGDGVNDDQIAIQTAIDICDVVFLPKGNYRLANPIVINRDNCRIIGEGVGATTITSTSVTNDMIIIGSSVTSVGNISVQGIYFDSDVAKSSGWCIIAENSHNIHIRDVRFGYNLHGSVLFIGGSQQFLYYLADFEINSGLYGVVFDGYVQDVWVDRGIVAGCDVGFWFKDCSGIYMKSVDTLSCNYGVQMVPGVGERVRLLWLHQIICDTSGLDGWYLNTNGGGEITGVSLVDCWGASTVSAIGTGFQVGGSGPIRGIQMTNFRAINNAGVGVALKSGKGITLTNPQISQNSAAANNTYDGLVFEANMTDWSVVGGVVGGAAAEGGINRQRTGIRIDAGCARYSIIGVNVTDNQTSGINDIAYNGSIKDCPGYRTENHGNLTIAAGTFSVNVPHGLPFTPELALIRLTPFSSLVDVNAGGALYVTGADATTFNVRTQTAVSTDLFIGWSISARSTS